nr:expressed conserved protein [Hymenolepis microstoma]
MSKLRKAAIYCFKTFSCACKTISIVCVFVAIAFLIAGVILVVKNQDALDDDDHDSHGQEWRNFGISLIFLGLCLLIFSLCSSFCAFQIGICKRCLQEKHEPEGEIITDHFVPQSQPSGTLPPTYPSYAADYQPPPQGPYPTQEPYRGRVPPNRQPRPIPNLPPTLPPSYEDVVRGAPTAPPAEEIPTEKL